MVNVIWKAVIEDIICMFSISKYVQHSVINDIHLVRMTFIHHKHEIEAPGHLYETRSDNQTTMIPNVAMQILSSLRRRPFYSTQARRVMSVEVIFVECRYNVVTRI